MRKLSKVIIILLFGGFLIFSWNNSSLAVVWSRIHPLVYDSLSSSTPNMRSAVSVYYSTGYAFPFKKVFWDSTYVLLINQSTNDSIWMYNGGICQPGSVCDTIVNSSGGGLTIFWDTATPLDSGKYIFKCSSQYVTGTANPLIDDTLSFDTLFTFCVGLIADLPNAILANPDSVYSFGFVFNPARMRTYPYYKNITSKKPDITCRLSRPVRVGDGTHDRLEWYNYKFSRPFDKWGSNLNGVFDSIQGYALTCSLYTLSGDTFEIYNSGSTLGGFVADIARFWSRYVVSYGDTISILDSLLLTVKWDNVNTDTLFEGKQKVRFTALWNYYGIDVRVSRLDSFEVRSDTSGTVASTEPYPYSNNYSNGKPDFETMFYLFTADTTFDTSANPDTITKIDTNYLRTDAFLDTGLVITLYPRNDILFNNGAARDGMVTQLDTVGQGRVKFILSWDDPNMEIETTVVAHDTTMDTTFTYTYPPLGGDSTYWYEVNGGILDYHYLLVYFANTTTGSFTVDSVTPRMALKGLNLDDIGYVSTNPSFILTGDDPKSGILTDSLFIDLYKVDLEGVYAPTDTIENRSFLKTLTPDDFELLSTVALVHTKVQLEDGEALDVWAFNGRPYVVSQYMNSFFATYPDSLGPMDYVWNLTVPTYKRFYVDGMSPHIRMSPNSTHKTLIFEISDTSSTLKFESVSSSIIDTTVLCSGVNTGSAKLYENFQIVSPDSTKYSSSTGVYTIYYSPSSENVWLMLDIADKVGNKSNFKNYYEDDQLSLVNPHNYPNPFSPVSPRVDQRRTIIDPGLTRTTDMEISISIYDLAGRYVATVEPVQTTGGKIIGYWDGRTKDGTLVANGVYLCYIQVRDTAKNKSLSEVIKIAVAKNDDRIF